MSISASMVKELRDKTGAGMMDCKKALEANDGDREKALDWLRQKGLSKAAKRADRATSEGLIGFRVSEDGTSAVAVEVKCETDFVARGEKFLAFAKDVTDHTVAHFVEDHDALMAQPFLADPTHTLQEALGEAVASIGENLIVGRAVRLSAPDGLVGGYVHATGKLAALVEVHSDNAAAAASEEAKELAKNVAMQIAASSPLALDISSLDPALIAREREVYRQKAREDGKPEAIIDKIADGAVKKYCKEVCLLDQPYIRDDKMSIQDLLAATGKKLGAKFTLGRFVRIQLGA